jgi:hypothetical protein
LAVLLAAPLVVAGLAVLAVVWPAAVFAGEVAPLPAGAVEPDKSIFFSDAL